jgi:hypothetical protein
MTGVSHHAYLFSVQMESFELFAQSLKPAWGKKKRSKTPSQNYPKQKGLVVWLKW